jgi:threonylcarbamoyladenosine tRNA methylthiotransferase MtaB
MTASPVSIITFGCRANQYETAMMENLLALADREDDSQVFVLNACTVTGLADRKARQAARRIRRENPSATIVLIGCLADAVAQGLARFPDVDLLAGNAWKTRIVEVVDRARAGEGGLLPQIAPDSLANEVTKGDPRRIRAFLKIQDGCGRACTYCRTTQVRGAPRSKPLDAVSAEAEALVASGFPEIVLTGIDLAQYAPAAGDLAAAIERVLAIDGLRRLRLASLSPLGLATRTIAAMAADPRACPHFHLPIQSGDDRILRAMARSYTVRAVLERVAAVRAAIPQATFGADLIVAFPGEDEAAFENTCRLVDDIGLVNLHAFRFSPRPGTVAAELPDPVPGDVARHRAETLDARWRRNLRALLDNRIGSTHHVLVEERRGDEWRGYTSDYLYVHFASRTDVPIGSIRQVRIVAVAEDHLEGTIDA